MRSSSRGVVAFSAALFIVLHAFAANAWAASSESVSALARQERPLLLDTLKELVAIESGSSDIEGLDRIRGVIAARLTALGAKVETLEPDAGAKGAGVPEKLGKNLRATFTGTG